MQDLAHLNYALIGLIVVFCTNVILASRAYQKLIDGQARILEIMQKHDEADSKQFADHEARIRNLELTTERRSRT